MAILFSKYEALANDFVVIDAVQSPVELTPALVKDMADRRRGIGFDQCLVLEKANDPAFEFVYRIFNSDGSEVSQCGNGARALALYCQEHYPNSNGSWRLKTLKGEVTVSCADPEAPSASMGVPILAPEAIPLVADTQRVRYGFQVDGAHLELAVLSVGNPHAVYQVSNVERAPLERLGKALSEHVRFPEKTNVEFVQLVDETHIKMRVYERGVGETMACGSGACAAMVALRLQGKVAKTVEVEQPGGLVTVTWQGLQQPVVLTGPARKVFTGTWCGQTAATD